MLKILTKKWVGACKNNYNIKYLYTAFPYLVSLETNFFEITEWGNYLNILNFSILSQNQVPLLEVNIGTGLPKCFCQK